LNRRPRLTLLGTSASPAEAAAVIAAVERFLRDHAPAPAAPEQRTNAWLRAARLEGLGRGASAPEPWGDSHPWG
jgi:hypothetical protein